MHASPEDRHRDAGTNEPTDRDSQQCERRLDRIYDYREAAITREDPLESVIGSCNSDLMLLSFQLQQSIQEELDAKGRDLASFRMLDKPLEQVFKLNRQIDRYAGLDPRLREARVVLNSRKLDGKTGKGPSEENES